MNRFLIRLRLFLKLWFTSVYPLMIMLLIPVVALIIYNSQSYTIESLSSVIYEKAAPIWFIFILQWCFSIDFDSKFYHQVVTYPVARWKFLLERSLFSTLIFFGLMCGITILLTPMLGSFLWKGFVFTIPVYMGLGGVVTIGAIIGNHSLGGLLAGILFWMIYLFGGALLKELNAILLVYQSVYRFVSGQSGFFSIENHWIIYNRLFYIGLGVLLTILAILKFNRKSV